MPSKIEFELIRADDKSGDKCYIIEAIMSCDTDDSDVTWSDTPFDAESVGCPGQRLVFDFESRNKKLSGTYILYYTIDSETINIYRINDKGEEYLIDPANYDINCERWRGDYDDPAWAHLGYCDSESESDDE
jgi:hypothetical protein